MESSKQIELAYYAVLREQRGLARETRTTAAASASALYEELKKDHGFHLEARQLRVVINDAFAPWDASLNEGDRVVFIPPVAGG